MPDPIAFNAWDPDDLIHRSEDDFRLCARAAEIEMQRSEYDAAINRLQNALLEDPENVTAITILAECFYAVGKKEDALMYWEKALSADAYHARALLGYAPVIDIEIEPERFWAALVAMLEANPYSSYPEYLLRDRFPELFETGSQQSPDKYSHIGDLDTPGAIAREIAIRLGISTRQTGFPKDSGIPLNDDMIDQLTEKMSIFLSSKKSTDLKTQNGSDFASVETDSEYQDEIVETGNEIHDDETLAEEYVDELAVENDLEDEIEALNDLENESVDEELYKNTDSSLESEIAGPITKTYAKLLIEQEHFYLALKVCNVLLAKDNEDSEIIDLIDAAREGIKRSNN